VQNLQLYMLFCVMFMHWGPYSSRSILSETKMYCDKLWAEMLPRLVRTRYRHVCDLFVTCWKPAKTCRDLLSHGTLPRLSYCNLIQVVEKAHHVQEIWSSRWLPFLEVRDGGWNSYLVKYGRFGNSGAIFQDDVHSKYTSARGTESKNNCQFVTRPSLLSSSEASTSHYGLHFYYRHYLRGF